MARQFAGGTNAISCGNAASLNNLAAFTWCCKIRVSSNSATVAIFDKGGSSAKIFRIQAASFNGELDFLVETSSTTHRCQTGSQTLPINTDMFIAATFDGVSTKVFTGMPGGHVSECRYRARAVGTGSPSSDAATPLRIGGNGTAGITGKIWEAKVIARALSADELNEVMYGKIPAPCVADLRLTGTTGNTEPDFSGLGNNGTVTGATIAADGRFNSFPWRRFAALPSVTAPPTTTSRPLISRRQKMRRLIHH